MDDLKTLQALLPRLRDFGHKECFLQMEREDIARWTCAEVAEAAEKLASGLAQAGLQPGMVVPILASSRPEWVIAALAILRAGAAVSPLDYQMTTDTLEKVLQDSEARFIFTTTNYLNRLGQLDLDNEVRPILFDVEAEDERGWRALLSDAETPLPTVKPDDFAALFYTSGTTGIPKGVPLTHHNLVFQIKAIDAVDLLIPEDRVLLPLPMYHVYPFTIGTLVPLAFGLPIIIPQSLTGPQVIRALKEGEVTIIVGVPRVYRAVFNGIESRIAERGKVVAAAFQAALKTSIAMRRRFGINVGERLFRPLRTVAGPKVRLLTSGGSALDPALGWKLVGFGWEVGIGYGLTETSPMLTMNLLRSERPKLGSVGPALSGIDLRIEPSVPSEEDVPAMNETGEGPTEGEILARGVSVFDGYRNRPEETAQSFNEEGWFRTGDLGYFDEDGYLYISGRASTLIVLEGGKKIQPDSLEELYEEHEVIREIAILYEDNQLVAVIVPDLDAVNRTYNGNVEQAIRAAVSEQVQKVPPYQRISDYVISQEPLERTNLGKIRRHILPDQYHRLKQGLAPDESQRPSPIAIADMSEKDQTLLEDAAAREVWEWLAERYADKALTPDTSPQLDLGVDSLEWLTLTLSISERTGIELSDEAVGRVNTVRDLLEEVVAAEESESVSLREIDDPEALLSEEQKQWLTPPPAILEWLFKLLFPVFQLLVRLYFRRTVYGLENLPDSGNFVLTPNHSSMLDAPTVGSALTTEQMRRTHWAGATDIMLANPFMRLVSRMNGILPIERSGKGTGIQNLALGMAAIKRGQNLVWFPEGRISRSDEMLPFLEGIGVMLEKAPALVVPVYIRGTRAAMPVDSMIFKPKPVSVTFGPPVESHQLAEEGAGETTPARIANALQQRVAALAEEAPALPEPSEETGVVNEKVWLVAGIITALALLGGLLWFWRRREK